MKSEGHPSSIYSYVFIDQEPATYLFRTINSIVYEVQFKPTPYLFGEHSPFADSIVELVLKVVDAPTGVRPPRDAVTAPTIAAIINDFYERSSQTITIYICDSSDKRQKARWTTFNRWYDYFSARNYQRFDRTVFDNVEEVTYYCAVIISAENPHRLSIFEAFNRLLDGYNDPK
ncbi:hypothetical protein CLV58_102213 [Spirosoma oryzae]|uniref:Uncharacterized protein n=1 Tax=Spirosoma oryzae TaxID=1469603 RepID=A0A2T0TIC9_9BACT|nr:DUF6169 family protein [Spirosoma oryzae]PRY45464.1 hypothetical protein CLV58_102213 [Spirosoma oryzae]